ncbi:MAG: hypothetical protein H6739_14290 [Alphaproteobacteria bacterium]|nr:hypothetical protein [Alphaproteobacteria bacterium]
MGGAVLILTDGRDVVAPEVIDHLLSGGARVIRVNAEDAVVGVSLRLSGAEAALTLEHASGLRWSRAEVATFWHQRGALRWAHPGPAPEALAQTLNGEWRALADFVTAWLADGPSLGATPADPGNKLWQLLHARRCGLDIPETRVCTGPAPLQALLAQGPVITKALQDVGAIDIDALWAVPGTQGVADASALGPRFFPGLFQARVPKAYDVRVFALDDALHAAAIRPVAGAAASIDYRTQDPGRALRVVPWAPPAPVAEGLRRLMAALGLDAGVIDGVVTPEGRFVFLEVNLSGQFELFAAACNLPVAQDIAARLLEGT